MVFNVSPQIFATSGDHWMARNIILYKTHGSSDVANTWLCVNPNKLDVIPLSNCQVYIGRTPSLCYSSLRFIQRLNLYHITVWPLASCMAEPIT